MSVFIGYPSFMAYQMMKGKKGNNDGFPSIPGMIARYSALGLTNEQMAENPVWKNLIGNGHDLQMKNFAWKGMSGVGGYVTNKDIYEYDLDRYSYTFIESGAKVHDFYIVFELIGYDENFKDGFNLDVRSISQGLKYRKTYTKNGIYIFQYKDEEGLDDLFAIGYNGNGGARSNFTVKVLPLYPGALVFDGVDDCGVCDNFPILTKEKGYTVVALRQWISMGEGISGLVSNVKNWFNDGAFVLEYNSNNATNKFVNRPVSFGNVNIEMDLPNNFTYQTSKSYKGVPITTGSFKGTNSLFVGKLNNIIGNCSNVAIWELVFLDHDATEEELTKIKDYFVKTYPWLFPDQAWTVTGKTNEDEDRATIANITGNGNDLILSNFGFAEGSGYNEEGEYAGYLVTDGVDDEIVSAKLIQFADKFTIVGDWKFMEDRNDNAGLLKSNQIYIYNATTGMRIYLKQGSKNYPFSCKKINALTSDGWVYDEKWDKYKVYPIGSDIDISSRLFLGFYGSNFTKIALKNLGIYNDQLLSKDDCIKAYNYLQTLKAK